MASWLSRVLAQMGSSEDPQAEAYMENAGPFAGTISKNDPVRSDRGLGSRMLSGAARGGLVGGLVGAFADPEADRGDAGANAYDATMGVVKSLGRGFVAGSGGDPYASERMDMQRESLGLQRENSLLARHRMLKEMTKEQRAEQLHEALSGIDPNTDPDWRSKASGIALKYGDPDLAIKLANAPQPKGAQTREIKSGDTVITQEMQPDGTWKELATAPRYRPTTNVNVAAPATPDLDVQLDPATGRVAGVRMGTRGAFTAGTNAQIEQKIDDVQGEIAALDEIAQTFDRSYHTAGGQLRSWGAKWEDYLTGEVSPEQRDYLDKFTDYQASVAQNMNAKIRAITGAAVTKDESPRLMREIVNPEDSPTQAAAKLRRSMRLARLSLVRLDYERRNGLATGSVPLTADNIADAIHGEAERAALSQGRSADEARTLADRAVQTQLGFLRESGKR